MRKISEVKARIRELEPQIDAAFRRRRLETFTPDGQSSYEALERQRRDSAMYRGRPDTDVVQVEPVPANPHQVIVDSLEDYELVGRLALKRVCRAVGRRIPASEIRQIAAGYRIHEEAHAEPYLEHPKTEIVFGVSFVQDRRTGMQAVSPFMELRGEVQVGARRKSLAAPEDLSPGDKTAIEHSK